MTDVKGLKERLEAKARASFEANKSFGRKGTEWAIETEVEWQALAYIADLEAKLAALDQEVERWVSSCQIAQDQAMENGGRASRAEAKLAVAREELREIRHRTRPIVSADIGNADAYVAGIHACAVKALNTIGDEHG